MDTRSLDPVLRDYLGRLAAVAARGDAREESFYPAFQELLEGCAAALGRRVSATAIPRKTADCLLDFQVWSDGRVVGYVEAKAPGADLAAAAKSEQVERYRRTFPNLLLADFREIRLFRAGAAAGRAGIAPGEAELRLVLERFFTFGGATGPASAAWLAESLAARARVLAGRVQELLHAEQARGEVSRVGGLFLAFRGYLRADLGEREFADLYAQTLAYGLRAARLREVGTFDRRAVSENIPRGSGILRDLFEYISLGCLPPAVDWIVADLIDLLAAAPIRRIVDRHFRQRGKDPIQHFYETFLLAYDRGQRKQRGVYYTPRPVVSFMVNSVHSLLRSRFGLADGLADPGVVLLDPAAGTLTFLVEAFEVAMDAHAAAHGPGGLAALARDHLVPHFNALELMMAPYAVGHLFFGERGRPVPAALRLRLFLANTPDLLDAAEPPQTTLPFVAELAREAQEAARIVNDLPVSVVLGNPPWSGRSANHGKEIRRLVRADYGQVAGEALGERNPKWLLDDAVQFLRLAQRKIEQNGEGIVCLVLPHGLLDNPTFRGLRRSLLDTFEEIRVLDLHGNQRKRERTPQGERDENVFAGVEQGVAIVILVKKAGLPRRVLRADLWGDRALKHRRLAGRDLDAIDWMEVRPRAPALLLLAGDDRLAAEYARGWPLAEIFPLRSVGVLTARDEVAIGFDRDDLEVRIERLRAALCRGEARPFRLDPGRTERARRALADGAWREEVRDILYRPFDRRVVLYADWLVDRPRRAGMRPFLTDGNLGLVAPRQARERGAAFVTDRMIAHKTVAAYDINSVFPLWRAPEGLFGAADGRGAPNVSGALLAALAAAYGEPPSPAAVLAYVYAVLHSPQYRRKYAPFLLGGFPCLPFPAAAPTFARLAALGAKLVDLHLLRSERLREPRVRAVGDGALAPGRRPRYDPAACRVTANTAGLAFEGIEPPVWEYRIGGYRVLERWVAARAGRRGPGWAPPRPAAGRARRRGGCGCRSAPPGARAPPGRGPGAAPR